VEQEQKPDEQGSGLDLRFLGFRLRVSKESLSDILAFLKPERRTAVRAFFYGLFAVMVCYAVSLII
jgi:hypothetical protein